MTHLPSWWYRTLVERAAREPKRVRGVGIIQKAYRVNQWVLAARSRDVGPASSTQALEDTVNDHMPLPRRSARSVLDSHLHHVMIGDLEGDLTNNYATPVIILTSEGLMSGHNGLRRLARTLRTYDRDGTYKPGQIWVAGEIGMLPWTVNGPDSLGYDGADTFLIRDGHIWTQTSHYSIRYI